MLFSVILRRTALTHSFFLWSNVEPGQRGSENAWSAASSSLLNLDGACRVSVSQKFLRRQGARRRARPLAGRDRVRHGRHHPHRQRQFPQSPRLLARRNPGQASQHVRRSVGARQRGVSRFLGGAQARRIPGRRIQADRQGGQGGLDPGHLQPGARRQRQAGQGREVCDRHHRAQDQEHGGRRPDRRDQPRAGGHCVRNGRHHRHRQ